MRNFIPHLYRFRGLRILTAGFDMSLLSATALSCMPETLDRLLAMAFSHAVFVPYFICFLFHFQDLQQANTVDQILPYVID